MKWKTLVMCILVVLVMITIAATTSEAYIPSETPTTKAGLQAGIEQTKNHMNVAHSLANCARQLGFNDDHIVIQYAKNEWAKANTAFNTYNTKLNAIYAQEQAVAEKRRKEAEAAARWAKKEQEYPVATKVWKYLKGLGYNDYVCAGIMGNMMAEVGGQTLNLDYDLTTKYYYGLCQWSKGYYQVWGADVDGQLKFLAESIRYEFNTYGFCYKKGFKYNDFLNLQNEQQAALAFSKCYERCASYTYSVRQKNATKAYNYFVG